MWPFKCDKSKDIKITLLWDHARDIAIKLNGCHCVEKYILSQLPTRDLRDQILTYAKCQPYEHDCPERQCCSCKKTSPVQWNSYGNNFCPFCGIKEHKKKICSKCGDTHKT